MNFIIGLFTGIAASMGLGGGFILIIYLTVFMGVENLTARAANLVFFLPIALFSVILHSKNKLIEWKIILPLIISGVIGSALGTLFGLVINPRIIEIAFGGVLVFVGAGELFRKRTAQSNKEKDKDV